MNQLKIARVAFNNHSNHIISLNLFSGICLAILDFQSTPLCVVTRNISVFLQMNVVYKQVSSTCVYFSFIWDENK